MILPEGKERLRKTAIKLAEICRSSQGSRAAVYKSYGSWIETGSDMGQLGLANMLFSHIERLQAHLFSPTGLRFTVGFDRTYPKKILAQAEVAARVVSREWERNNIDLLFGGGVGESLSYGASFLKQGGYVTKDGVNATGRIISPWRMGVYNECENSLDKQEVICETVTLTEPEVWRRISHLPDAEDLYKRILGAAKKSSSGGPPEGFMHQVLSTAVLDTSESASPLNPGGIVNTSSPAFQALGPVAGANTVDMHELWVKDDKLDDLTTIQIIEPDILVAPIFKRTNLFCPRSPDSSSKGLAPYTLIQPNSVPGYFWGRSEIVDLQMLQRLLSSTLVDIQRVMGSSFDKLLAFPGFDGLTDEAYGQFRSQGYLAMPQGATATDLTPKLPEHALEFVNMTLKLMDMVSGFHNILSGQGESGVRAGVHADTLMRTASPRLRDRSLIVERQCAMAGDATLSFLAAKDARVQWSELTDGQETEFLLKQIPQDRRVSVDSHSSSPIYQVDHENLVAFGLKAGIIDGLTAIDLLPLPQKDLLRERFKENQARKAQFIKDNPEILSGKKGREAAASV